MSEASFPAEGELPARPGGERRSFHAYKKIPIRAYCWHSEADPDTWYISHFVNKTWTKRRPEDRQTVINNWRRIEIDGEPY